MKKINIGQGIEMLGGLFTIISINTNSIELEADRTFSHAKVGQETFWDGIQTGKIILLPEQEYLAGYKFKPSHDDIHFVKHGYKEPGDDYSDNFTMNAALAKTFATDNEAKETLLNLMSVFKADDDYQWTPIIFKPDGTKITLLVSDWMQ